jgi:hypothetical protein
MREAAMTPMKNRASIGGMRAARLLTPAALALLWCAPAAAQDCGSWSRPVLCTAELVATDSAYRTVRLSPRARLQLAPRQSVDLELEARDQNGRRFPAEALSMQYDDGACGAMLDIEDRGEGVLRLSANAVAGRCVMEIWTPNNLNFYWELEVIIEIAARTGYERDEAEVVANALYAGILGRESDFGGFQSAVVEIQNGNLEGLVNGMVRSPEFRQSIAGLTPSDILERFYQGVLGRAGDSAGVRLYLGEMRRGEYASVLLKLIRSPEFERRLVR